MHRTAARFGLVTFAVLAYAAFLVSFVYTIAFLGDFAVPKTVDAASGGPWWAAALIDAGLLGLFAVQHSVMARPAFKAAWTRVVPAAAERSVYVLAASLALGLVLWQWRPVEGTVWTVRGPLAAFLVALSLAGWGLCVAATFMIHHLDLFGLRQAYLKLAGLRHTEVPFTVRGAYAVLRQPMMLGILAGVWATPRMTAGHLLFAALATGYIVVGTRLEESDLARQLGPEYAEYRRRVPMFLPRLRRPATSPARV